MADTKTIVVKMDKGDYKEVEEYFKMKENRGRAKGVFYSEAILYAAKNNIDVVKENAGGNVEL